MRLLQETNHDDTWPECPRLYDAVVAIPVVARGDPPPDRHPTRISLVADWLLDIVENES